MPTSDSRHDSATIATPVATTVVRFEAMEVAVDVQVRRQSRPAAVRTRCEGEGSQVTD